MLKVFEVDICLEISCMSMIAYIAMVQKSIINSEANFEVYLSEVKSIFSIEYDSEQFLPRNYITIMRE